MSFINELGILFTGMTAPVVLALVLGYIFIVIEIFQPGFGIFGIIGGILVILGVVLRVIAGDGNPYAQIFTLLFLETLGVFIAFMVLALTAKKGWLNRSPLIETGTAVGIERSDGTPDYHELEGKIGIALTDLRPIGRANIEGVVVDVVSDGFFIKKGEGVRVVKASGMQVSVERAE